MKLLLTLLGAYLFVINLDGFALMASDKSRARRGKRPRRRCFWSPCWAARWASS